MISTVTFVSLLLGVAGIAFAAGWWLARRSDDEFVDAAARASYRIVVEEQTERGLDALRALPPMVSAADAVEHATRTGLSVPEAAEALYRARVRAVIDDRISRTRLDRRIKDDRRQQ